MFFVPSCQSAEPEGTVSAEEKAKNQIEILIDAMALPNRNVDNICRRLIEEYGEQAIPELSSNIENRIPIVRLLCTFCLGQIYERTKSQEILELKPKFAGLLYDPVHKVRLEAAATLISMQDYQGIPMIIDALRNESAYVRMIAAQILFKTFNETFGYQYYEDAKKREPAAQRWEAWWRENKAQYLKSSAN